MTLKPKTPIAFFRCWKGYRSRSKVGMISYLVFTEKIAGEKAKEIVKGWAETRLKETATNDNHFEL